MSGSSQPTPYTDVNAVLTHFLSQIRVILGDQFRGMYLDGSLALGDFNPRTSDIDFVVTTAAVVSEEHFVALRALHAYFNASASPWATEVEAVYLPQTALRCAAPESVPQLRIERGPHEVLVQGYSDRTWITHWSILRDHPAVLAGPDPRTLIAPIAPHDLRRAMADLAAGWLTALRRNPAPLQHRGPLTYTVLTLCRMLYTLRWGVVPSKPRAARWAQQEQEERWRLLIERALAWRKAPAPQDPVTDAERRAALALLAYTVDQCRSLGRSLTQPEP